MRTRPTTLDEIMDAAGVSPADTGQYVDELRAKTTKALADGLQARHWSWGPEAFRMTPDERAKYVLGVDWAIERKHSSPVTHEFDSKCPWWHLRHHAARALARFRALRDRGRNPYRDVT